MAQTPSTGTSPHQLVNPDTMYTQPGYSHAVLAAPGRLVAIAGQNGHDLNGNLPVGDLVEHFDRAATGVVDALAAVGARPEDMVSLQIFVRDAAEYREAMPRLAPVYQRHFGRHYPVMGVFVTGLLYDDAKIELMPLAVIPFEND